ERTTLYATTDLRKIAHAYDASSSQLACYHIRAYTRYSRQKPYEIKIDDRVGTADQDRTFSLQQAWLRCAVSSVLYRSRTRPVPRRNIIQTQYRLVPGPRLRVTTTAADRNGPGLLVAEL